MKKSNLFTLLILGMSIIGAIIFMEIQNIQSSSKDKELSMKQKEEVVIKEKESVDENKKVSDTDIKKETSKPIEISMEDALFIGDSRTVGLMEYSKIVEADYFCAVGMSVFNIHDEPVSVPNVGKITLTELLNNKDYNKIYIMLGVNEMGYQFEKILEKYQALISFIKSKEPNANVILLGNLHVTQSRSDSDHVFNNNAINKLNKALSKFADNKEIFYLDANVLFDDENGALSADKSSDNTHLYAKYYEEWGKWIKEQTALMGKGE